MPKEFVDFRSDTVTLPTQEMLEAINTSSLGDDVFREDETVNKLEKLTAERMGKEAALLVSSGTQANLVSLISNTQRGNLVILEEQSHIYWYEAGGISSIAGLQPWPVKSSFGAFDPLDLEKAIKQKDIHFADPALICIENTHNRHGGTIITPEQLKKISEIAHSHELKLYMDGARIFNASVALKKNVKEFTKHVDNMMFCLSKGLCCPIGSVIVGSYDFIEKARKIRKVLGGGMRQAGIIAAPGIVALEKMVDRLEDDHKNARILAEELNEMSGINVDLLRVQTNIVNFEISSSIMSTDEFLSRLNKAGILALELGANRIRMVTHHGIDEGQVKKTIEIIKKITN